MSTEAYDLKGFTAQHDDTNHLVLNIEHTKDQTTVSWTPADWAGLCLFVVAIVYLLSARSASKKAPLKVFQEAGKVLRATFRRSSR